MTPHPEQLAAVRIAVQKRRGIIEAVTGSGKSLMIGLLIQELQVPTLIVTPSLELKTQLTESLKSWFGANKVGKGRPIWVENVQGLRLQPVLGYDCLIIDEFHHSAALTYRQLNKKAWMNIYYRFGFTATPFRSNEAESILLETILSTVIYKLSYKRAVEAGYIVPVEAFYVDLPKTPTDAHTWAQVYSTLVTKNDTRNTVIADLVLSLTAPTLVLVKEVAHGKALSDLTGIPFVHGQDEESRDYIQQFNSGKILQLIGTTGIISEGVDTKPCEWVIIAGLGKAKSAFMQQVGRAVRRYGTKDSAKIVIFRDKSHRFTLRHFSAQTKILLTEYGVQPIKIIPQGG